MSAAQVHWRAGERRQLDLFDLKGALESVAPGAATFRRGEKAGLPFAAEIVARDRVIGYAGQLASGDAEKLGATAPVFVLEIHLDAIADEIAATGEISPSSTNSRRSRATSP